LRRRRTKLAEEKNAKDSKKDAKDKKDVKKDDKKDGKKDEKKKASEKPTLIKYGINHVTTLVETKKAKLVVVAHDVDPIEIVVWLPALCRKMGVPCVIVKSKARLGILVHKKTTTAVAVTDLKAEDNAKFEQLVVSVRLFEEGATKPKWGGGVLGPKANAVQRAKDRAAQREAQKRNEPK